jgi:hypothetical protein
MPRRLIDDMLDEWSRAMKADREPARWRINAAAWMELQRDERVYLPYSLRNAASLTLLGAPIAIIDDRQAAPSFYLNTDSRC